MGGKKIPTSFGKNKSQEMFGKAAPRKGICQTLNFPSPKIFIHRFFREVYHFREPSKPGVHPKQSQKLGLQFPSETKSTEISAQAKI